MEAIKTKAVFNAEVITLSRMAYRVLNEIGGNSKTHLSKCGKAMLIFDILNKQHKIMSKKFAELSQLNLSQVNKEVLAKWDENDVFSKSMTEREGCPSFVFYEGPPSANGMPGTACKRAAPHFVECMAG